VLKTAIGSSSVIVVVLYRPGSEAVQQKFFDEMADVLDRFATYQMPIYVVGDFNVRLDRPDDPHANQNPADVLGQLCEAFNCRILYGRYAANIHTYV